MVLRFQRSRGLAANSPQTSIVDQVRIVLRFSESIPVVLRRAPHVTVGAHPQTSECERIANQLNEERRTVRARINSVEVIEMGESMVRTVTEIKLGSV
jgi:hypothetical protein